MWKPGWGETPPDEFQAEVRSFIDQHQESGWVADGNYLRRGGLLMHEAATDIVCEYFRQSSEPNMNYPM